MIEITGGARTLRALALATALLALATARAEAAPFLTDIEVRFIAIIAAATSSLDSMVIAVTDREGVPLAVFRKTGAPIVVPGNFGLLEDANDVAACTNNQPCQRWTGSSTSLCSEGSKPATSL